MLESGCPMTAYCLADAYGNSISSYKPDFIRYSVPISLQYVHGLSEYIRNEYSISNKVYRN